jgi:hypothetical protein
MQTGEMNMTAKKLMLATAMAGAFLPAMAAALEEEAPAQDHAAERAQTRQFHIVTPAGGTINVGGRHTVKNAPYSAEMVNERTQVLADGNQISNRRVTMSYRDSQGRTRVENRDDKGELASIMIQDPAAGVTYALNPRNKTAIKMTRFDFGPALAEGLAGSEAGRSAAEAGHAAAEHGRAAAEAARMRIEQLRKEGKLPTVERRRTADGEEIVIKRVEINDGKGETRHERRFEIDQVLAGAFADRKWSGNSTAKDLGTRDVDGVKAQGKLVTYEIPAGAIGNRNPIVVSDEHWYSPDLQVTVYTKHSDPRSGEVVYRLEKIKRDEPQAALFTVPTDYTVKDMARGPRPAAHERGQQQGQQPAK